MDPDRLARAQYQEPREAPKKNRSSESYRSTSDLDRTMTDTFRVLLILLSIITYLLVTPSSSPPVADMLYLNDYFTAPVSPPNDMLYLNGYSTTPVSLLNDILSQRLQEAANHRLATPHPPLLSREDYRSAFRAGSPLRPSIFSTQQLNARSTFPRQRTLRTVTPDANSLTPPLHEQQNYKNGDSWDPISCEETFLYNRTSGKHLSEINTGIALPETDSTADTSAKYIELSAIDDREYLLGSHGAASPYTANHPNPQFTDVEVIQVPTASSANDEKFSNSMGLTETNLLVFKKRLYREGSLSEEQALRVRELGTAILREGSDNQELDTPNIVAGNDQGHYYDPMKLSEALGHLDPFDHKSYQRTWRHDDPSPATPKNSLRANRRKVLRVLIKGREHLSCPDSGASENIMSEDFANHEGFHIRPRAKMFQLGNGQYVSSTGMVSASVVIPGLPLTRRKQAFFVLPHCPVPLIMGLPFLEEAEIMSKNRHVLESCAVEWKNISHLLWIGSTHNRMKCSFGGRNLIGVADTGSDLNMMSLKCAEREGFDIDQRESARRRIKFGDGSEAETVGQVYVYNLGFDWRQPETEAEETNSSSSKDSLSNDAQPESVDEDCCETFHVFPGLPCDLIFGRDLLDRLDAFNLSPDLASEHTKKRKRSDEVSFSELNVLIDTTGPIFPFFPFLKRRKNNQGKPIPLNEKEKHDDDWDAEIWRRSRTEDNIKLLPQAEQEGACIAERTKVAEWDQLHAHCLHCHPI